MKIIISYQYGRVEILSVPFVDDLQFTDESLIIQFGSGNVQYIKWRDIRSIAIA